MRITKIEPQKKRPGRKNIYADGEFVAGVSNETLARLGVRQGDDLTPEKLGVLRATEELYSAKQVALRFLTHRPRTIREVRDKLREKEFADQEITRTLQDLQQAGLLNDEEFARMYVRDALALRPAGRLGLKQKMLLLGVDKTTVENVLAELIPGTGEESLAREAARRFLTKSGEGRDRGEQLRTRQRLSAFLARRGFSWDVISTVVKQVLNDQSADIEP